jgi:hypothetical protein
MTALDIQRELVIEKVLDATTLPEINDARRALREWLTAHPDEVGMRDGFEQLSLMEDALQEQNSDQLEISTVMD